ncbi:MAG: class I SAM-dependent methyltransferase [Clostridia bacterium]|nr:class I SAM-dependent methyltransferase [Clostridia bacterium]
MINAIESQMAKLCAFVRAYHVRCDADLIYDDRLAGDLLGEDDYEEMQELITERAFTTHIVEGPDPEQSASWKDPARPVICEYFLPILLPRIAFTETALQEFREGHESAQFIDLGAGLDTYAFRNTDPGLTTYELDHPATQRYKRRRIKRLGWEVPEELRFVPIDFSRDIMFQKLVDAGYDPNRPTFVALMGVTYYLRPEVLQSTFAQIAEMVPPGSRLALDFGDETSFRASSGTRMTKLAEITEDFGEPMMPGLSVDTLLQMLEDVGFTVRTHLTPDDIQTSYFSARDCEIRAFENIHFLTVERVPKWSTSKPQPSTD